MQWRRRLLKEQEGFPCHVICCFSSRSPTALALQTNVWFQPGEQWRAARALCAWEDIEVPPVLAPALVFDTGRIPGTGTGTCPSHRYWAGSAHDRGTASTFLSAKHAPVYLHMSPYSCVA